MAIEIFFQNGIKGEDIRGCAFHICDYFHEFLISHCVAMRDFKLLEALSLIDEENAIFIHPEAVSNYLVEFEKLDMFIDKDWMSVSNLIERLMRVMRSDLAKKNGFKCFVDS